MSTSSLAAIKKNYGITDDLPVKFEKTGDELVLYIPIRSTVSKNS